MNERATPPAWVLQIRPRASLDAKARSAGIACYRVLLRSGKSMLTCCTVTEKWHRGTPEEDQACLQGGIRLRSLPIVLGLPGAVVSLQRTHILQGTHLEESFRVTEGSSSAVESGWTTASQ